MAATKLILQKLMHTIDINVVQGSSYQNFSTQKFFSFITQKFPDLWYSFIEFGTPVIRVALPICSSSAALDKVSVYV